MDRGDRIACDVAVLGGGSAGCAVAGRMALESEAEVVLVEAGPDYGARSGGEWPADLLDGGALPPSHSWGYSTGDLHPGRGPIDLARARVIGGCSSHNGCAAAVGCPEDYDGWATLTGDDRWATAAVRPAFERALARLRVRVYTDDEVGPFHRACLDAAAALGWARADDLHDLDGGVSFGVEPVNIEGGLRFNAAFAYVDPARARGNFRIVADALVDRIVPGRDSVEVVAWQGGKEVRIDAGTAVLAAGAYGSPAILLRSGIGDPIELGRHGIAAVHALPGVGRNLHDHPMLEVEVEATPALRAALAAAPGFVPEEQTLGKLRSSRATGPYDLHLFPVAASAQSLLGGRTIFPVSAVEPRSRGRLTLASARPDDAPIIDHGYLTDPEGHDLEVLVEGVAIARELAATEPLRRLVGAEIVPAAGEEVRAAIRRAFSHYFHPVGTCAMGRAGDPFAVCDGSGRLHGLDRILVADCSLMPVIPRANTNVPAVMVGERIADGLLARM